MSTPRTSPAPVEQGLHPAVSLLAQTLMYKLSWPRMLTSNLMLCISVMASVTLNVVQFLHKEPPQYFATTADGRIIPIVPLNVPLVSTDKVLEFSQECITSSFTLDFVDNNLRKKLQSIRDCYTDEGYNALMSAYDSSGFIKKIRDRRYVTSATSGGAGVIARVDPTNARGYKWVVQQPISITLQNQTEKKSYSFVIETDIQRIPTVDNPRAIATAAVRIIGNGQN